MFLELRTLEQYIFIMCRSLTYAQRAARVLEKHGIYASVSRSPMGVSPEGCSQGVKAAWRKRREALELMRTNGIAVGKIYVIYDDGSAAEIKL